MTGSAVCAWLWKTANSSASRITFCAKIAASQSLARHQLEQAPLEEQQAAAGAPLDLGLGIGDAELAQAVQQHLEVAALVDHLRREEDLGEPVRRDGDQAARALERRGLADAVVAQHGDQAVALERASSAASAVSGRCP